MDNLDVLTNFLAKPFLHIIARDIYGGFLIFNIFADWSISIDFFRISNFWSDMYNSSPEFTFSRRHRSKQTTRRQSEVSPTPNMFLRYSVVFSVAFVFIQPSKNFLSINFNLSLSLFFSLSEYVCLSLFLKDIWTSKEVIHKVNLNYVMASPR